MNIADIRKKARDAKARDAEAPLPAERNVPAPAPAGATAGEKCSGDSPGCVTAGRLGEEAGLRSDTERLEQLFAEIRDLDESGAGYGGSAAESDREQSRRRWLAFRLDREEYALPITAIKEIIKPREITEIPRVPAFLLGIISLRGTIIPVIDLRARLKLGSATIDAESRIIVCQHNEQQAGLLVDRITQVAAIGEDAIEPPPLILSGIDRAFVDGIGRGDECMLILMNLPGVLTLDWE